MQGKPLVNIIVYFENFAGETCNILRYFHLKRGKNLTAAANCYTCRQSDAISFLKTRSSSFLDFSVVSKVMLVSTFYRRAFVCFIQNHLKLSLSLKAKNCFQDQEMI